MMSLVRSFILMVLFATNGAAQTSPLDLLLQQQSQGLPFGTDIQSLEDMFSGQGFDINPENEARTAKEPVIPSEQNVKLLDRRLTAEETQQRRQEGQALSNDLLGGQSKTQTPSMVETYYQILTGESLDVFGTGKSATSNNIANNPADEPDFYRMPFVQDVCIDDLDAAVNRGPSNASFSSFRNGMPISVPMSATGGSAASATVQVTPILSSVDPRADHNKGSAPQSILQQQQQERQPFETIRKGRYPAVPVAHLVGSQLEGLCLTVLPSLRVLTRVHAAILSLSRLVCYS